MTAQLTLFGGVRMRASRGSAKKKSIPAEISRAFAQHCQGWAAVYVAGPDSPISLPQEGDNVRTWPVRIGITRTLTDNVTRHANSWSPIWWQGVIFRLWTCSDEAANQLAQIMRCYVAERGPDLRNSWADLGPDTDVTIMEFEIRCIGEKLVGKIVDDNELWHWLDARALTSTKNN